MLVYVVEQAEVSKRWLQGIHQQSQIVVQCNRSNIVEDIPICTGHIRLLDFNVNIRNNMAREGQGGLYLLGKSKALY